MRVSGQLSRCVSRRQALLSTACATLLAAMVLLPLLGHKPLAEWDEGIYAEVSREMLGGRWLVPRWNDQLWFEKPPLMLWMTAVFFKLFGVSEFWARAGSAFSGVALVGLLHGWLARRRDLLAAWLSSVILLATFGFLHVCHVGEMDVLLSLGCGVALIGLEEVGASRAHGWYLFWIGFAVALMTKGAASVVIPITAVLLALVERWRWRSFGRAFGFGLALFLLLVLPWHLAMYERFGPAFVSEYLGLHVLTRAMQQIEGHRTHWWFYLEVLLVSAPPFCLVYPAAIVRGWGSPRLRVWAVFSLVVLVFFSVIQTRLPHYVAPAYPALSLLTAVCVADWLREHGLGWKLGGVAAMVWAASLVATHPTLKSLHSADLAGSTLRNNKQADALLRQPVAMTGPLLLWRDGPVQSLATVVFYARRPVQQVQLQAPAPGIVRDKYMFNPEPLAEAVGAEPRLILMDSSLVPQLPPQFRYRRIRSSADLELGVIAAKRP